VTFTSQLGDLAPLAANPAFNPSGLTGPGATVGVSETQKGRLPAGWTDALPRGKASDKAIATRNHSGNCINAIASRFQPVAELNLLPPECFVVVVKTARDFEASLVGLSDAERAEREALLAVGSGGTSGEKWKTWNVRDPRMRTKTEKRVARSP
jgi:hypothetical protein